MVLDTELYRKDELASGSGLDVDQFFSTVVLEPRRPPLLEATFCQGNQGQLRLLYVDRGTLTTKASTDAGRGWDEPRALVDAAGTDIKGDHATMLHMKSGRLGLVHSTTEVPDGRPGRDGGTVFRTSDDEGRIWSDPVVVERRFGICCSGHAIVHSSGRIVVPVFKWVCHIATGEAEEFNSPTLSYSYAYVSDDEGQTWQQSLSELFISHYRAAYDLEEPAVIELNDGRLLMHLRSQVGRMYRSYSEDRGISWSRPEGLAIAAGYTPCILRRTPATGDLIMIWNQVSRQEILTGLHRHRLTSAVSKDDGQTWESFKNLESLDDTTVLTPPPANRLEVMEQWEDYDYHQPADTERYHRAPGVVRICYPDAVFVGDEAIIVYDYGKGTLGNVLGTKLRAVPVSWFTA